VDEHRLYLYDTVMAGRYGELGDPMRGLMMDMPLLITSLIQFAAQYHGDTEIVSRSVEGPVRRTTYGQVFARAQKLANALTAYGIQSGDRVATLAWNTDLHLELYYAVSGIEAVCHTVNLRLGDEELIYIINHAEDRILFFDLDLAETVDRIASKLTTVERYVVMTGLDHMPARIPDNTVAYETLIGEESERFAWPTFNENTAASMCYTSGTTGKPKGVLYSHRSTVLHAMASCYASTLDLRTHDVVLPVVPMFHVNAWGVPYSAPIAGAPLVMPGPKLDGENLFNLMDAEGVSIALGVPTVWMGLLDHMDVVGRKPNGFDRVIIGGAAASETIIDRFEMDHGVKVHHAWGMTEMSPIGVVNTLKPKFSDMSRKEQMPIKVKQGRIVYGVDMRIVDDAGSIIPNDGQSSGRLHVRGPWIVDTYFKADESALTEDGWFDTGDIATLDADGYMHITDRAKDIIKSGGEWISSVGLENAAIAHPAIKLAAVIGIPHPKWQERPLLICVAEKGEELPSLAQVKAFLSDQVPKLWLPDALEWVDELPLGATGKILKADLRSSYADYTLPGK